MEHNNQKEIVILAILIFVFDILKQSILYLLNRHIL